MFAKLHLKGKLYAHRNPLTGLLRYHLALGTPNTEKRYIDFVGQRYWWKDSKSLILAETFIHKARNDTKKNPLNFILCRQPYAEKSLFTIHS